MELVDWIVLKLYLMQDALIYILVPLLLLSLAAAIFLTWKASKDRVVGR
ncbi:hypothetical protein [Candidatus Nitrospira bockiana]